MIYLLTMFLLVGCHKISNTNYKIKAGESEEMAAVQKEIASSRDGHLHTISQLVKAWTTTNKPVTQEKLDNYLREHHQQLLETIDPEDEGNDEEQPRLMRPSQLMFSLTGDKIKITIIYRGEPDPFDDKGYCPKSRTEGFVTITE